MLSRLYDERVFTSSDDVVFGASSSRALLRKSHGSHVSPVRRRLQHGVRGHQRSMRREELLEEGEDESKSGDSQSGVSESENAEEEADDELDDEDEDEEEGRRMAGLKFPMQSPRHIASSQSYLHRQRRRTQMLEGDESIATHRQARDPTLRVGNNHGEMVEVEASRNFTKHRVKAQYHDRPMELVYLPTGEIRPRDECPVGLKLPPPPPTDMRRLLDAPPSPRLKARFRQQVKSALGDSAASSTVHITRQEAEPQRHQSRNTETFRPSAIETKFKGQRHKSSIKASASIPYSRETSDDEHLPNNGNKNGRVNELRNQRDGAIRKHRMRYQREDDVSTSDAPVIEQPQKSKVDPVHSSSDDEEATTVSKHTSGHRRANNVAEMNRHLETQLQQERKRVLEKMTQLLEEQGKTQALQHKANVYEEKIAALQKQLDETSQREASALNRVEQVMRERNEQIETLSTQLRDKNDEIQRLNRQLDQASVSNRTRQTEISLSKDEEKITRLKQREASLAKQLEELMNRVTDFHAHVERWKANSREAFATCVNSSEVSELMDRLWRDFPPFLGDKSQAQSRCSTDEESSTIAFLTKKLRQKEEELRVTHVKYVELKELCARQCIREADLQNFINEHRLRGNLIIRNNTHKENGTGENGQDNEMTAENVNDVANGVRRRGRGDFALQPLNSFDEEESEGEDIVVRRPQVTIDVKRSNHSQQPGTPVEHVRLEPSPAFSHRHQNQRQGLATRYQHSGVVRSNKATASTVRSATVASAARTLGTTRQGTPTTATRSTLAQKKSTTSTQGRTTTTSRVVQSRARSTVVAKRTPLSSRPWV